MSKVQCFFPLPPDGVVYEIELSTNTEDPVFDNLAGCSIPALGSGMLVIESLDQGATRRSIMPFSTAKELERMLPILAVEAENTRVLATPAVPLRGGYCVRRPGQPVEGWLAPTQGGWIPMQSDDSVALDDISPEALGRLESWMGIGDQAEVEFIIDEEDRVSVLRSSQQLRWERKVSENSSVLGISAVTGVIEGPARPRRVADGPVSGILIIAAAEPSFAPVMATADGVICSVGGATSHFAVVARSLGIPALMGCSAIDVPNDGSTAVLKWRNRTYEIDDGDPIQLEVGLTGSRLRLLRTGQWIQ